MNDEVKTLGYLLKHYENNQCYDQYVPLTWLQERIRKEIDSYSGRSPVDHAVQAGLNRVLEILKS